MKLDNEPITVIRTAAGTYVAGRFVPGQAETFNAAGNIQPLSGAELQQLPEGDRQREVKKIYTAFMLHNGDEVQLSDGARYEVQMVQDWTAFSLPHVKAHLMRIEEP